MQSIDYTHEILFTVIDENISHNDQIKTKKTVKFSISPFLHITYKKNNEEIIYEIDRELPNKLYVVDNRKNINCCEEWRKLIKYVLYDEETINKRLDELAKVLTEQYKDKKNVLCVGLLNGCMMFYTHLLERVQFRHKQDFIKVSSYGHETVSSGSVKLKQDLDIDPSGYDVLIIEDLIDTGITLYWVKKHLENKGCKSIKICCLLDKKERRQVDVKIDYVGFDCPNKFVIGYGMDYKNEMRNLPFIGVVDEDKL